jgi:hypothetical protein
MRRSVLTFTSVLLFVAAPLSAKPEWRQGGKLLLTDGISTVEGAAGGGLTPWALIAGNETERGIGATASLTRVYLKDYRLTAAGAAVGLFDRVELSYQRQAFDTRAAGAALGLGRGFTFHQDIYGAKLRIAGDGIYAQDSLLPQIAVGAQYKRADRGAVITLIGGSRDSDIDFYASATKLVLARSLLLNGTVRFTRANQYGLLGYGGDRADRRTAHVEGSIGWLASRHLALGAEYRDKPDNLGFARERAAWDLFAAWAPLRNVTLTAAYVDLGPIATLAKQRGAFLQLQTGF